MASLYVAEFEQMIEVVAGRAPIAKAPPHAEQKLAIGVASVPSAAFHLRTKMVRLHADAICSVAFSSDGSDPTASAANMRMTANQTEYFGVSPSTKVAVITNT